MNLDPTSRTVARVDGESLFLAQLGAVERTIGVVCRRYHLDQAEGDEFGSYVKLKLIENDYAVLKKFQGRSSVRTYLAVVIHRLFLDYRNASWGKWRPSSEARRAGSTAVALEQLLVRDDHTFDEACEILRTNRGVSASPRELEQLAGRLPIRTRRRFESDDQLKSIPSTNGPAGEFVEAREGESAARQLTMVLESVMDGLKTQDRLILKMRYEDGRSVTEIATVLRLEQKALYRRIERLLNQLRSGLTANGIEASTILDISVTGEIELDWNVEKVGVHDIVRPPMPSGAQE